jgi:hypothetical protein
MGWPPKLRNAGTAQRAGAPDLLPLPELVGRNAGGEAHSYRLMLPRAFRPCWCGDLSHILAVPHLQAAIDTARSIRGDGLGEESVGVGRGDRVSCRGRRPDPTFSDDGLAVAPIPQIR